MGFFQRKVLGRPIGVWFATLVSLFATLFAAFELLRLDQHFNFLPYGTIRTTLLIIALSYAGSCMLLNLLGLIGITLRRFWGFTASLMGYALLLPAPAVLLWVWGTWGLSILAVAFLAGTSLYQNRRWFDETLKL